MSPELSENDKWFDERLCRCDRFEYPSLDAYNWEREFRLMLQPPYCKTCNKWANRVHLCVRCSQNYYQFFWHPLMGWEPSLPLQGWECWDCLEAFQREVGTPVNCRKVPPPQLVVSPYHIKLLPPTLSESSQKLFDDFDALLNSI